MRDPHKKKTALKFISLLIGSGKALITNSLRRDTLTPPNYPTLFSDLREELSRAVKRARNAKPKKGLWAADKTGGFDFTSKASVTDDNPILPKLFRRLIEHLQSGGNVSNFKGFLKKKRDGVLILPKAHHTDALDYVVDVKGKRVSMNVLPENLVFDPKG